MNRGIHILFLWAILLSVSANAGPVHKRVYTLEQPDGHCFQALFNGDEFMRIKTDLDGHAIIQDSDGWWCYASYEPDGRKTSSGCRVGEPVPYMVKSRSMAIPYQKLSELAGARRASVEVEEKPLFRRIRDGRAVRADGEEERIVKHGIVILAQFANLGFKHTREDFEKLLTSGGYSRNGASGCAKEYFDAQFNGSVDFKFDVSNIVTLSQNLAYYGSNVSQSNGVESDKAPEEMVIEACRLADQDIDFSIYDDDGDGEVDNVFVFFAGGDEAEGAGDDCIWSHAWYIRDGAGRNLILDGKVINRYACTSEMTRYLDTSSNNIKQRLAGIGSFCHEYSHTFGLADMYDTDYEGSGGLSQALWLSTYLMDGGNQNNGGSTPPYFSAIERDALGMSDAEVIESDGVYTLEPIHKSGKYYRLDTDDENEYFLLECRAEEGWDAYIGGKGMLIYHVDKSSRDAGYSDSYGRNLNADSRWKIYNEVNCRPDHQCADLIEAMPSAANVRNVFFPASGVNSLDSSFLGYWSGEECPVSLTGIRMEGSNVVFNVTGGSDRVPPEPVSIGYEKFQDAAVVTFESSWIYEGDALISWGCTGKEVTTLNLSPYEPGKYALVLDGLAPRTSYTVSIAFALDGVAGKEGAVSFMTSSDNGGYPYIFLKNVMRNPDGTFPAGSRIPLRVYNAIGAKNVSWTFDGAVINVDASGYYKVSESGVLKARITWEDGSVDVITKEIVVSE